MYDFFMEINLINKVYQMFVMGLEGENLENNPNLIGVLKSGLGGVIFFTQNIKTEEQFKTLIKDIKENALISPFLSIDQEGGRVERTENIHGGKKYLSAKFAAANGVDFLRSQTESISKELKGYGINLNFAPCVDVNTNPNNPIIGERAFSSDTDEVIKFGNLVVQTYLKNGITPCLKHFPGHGDASVDSHLALPKIELSLDEMEKHHIRPFKEIDCPMIMVAHLHCPCFDKEEIPSSLSENVVRKYLLEKLNYQGLVITDDMIMGGVLAFGAVKACEMAIKAGVNILLYRDSYDETIKIVEQLAKLAEKDEILRKNIELSYEKITKEKKVLQIT